MPLACHRAIPGIPAGMSQALSSESIVEGGLFQQAMEVAGYAILITDAEVDAPGPIIRYANAAMARLTGYGVEELVGADPRMLQGPDTDRAVLDQLKEALRQGRSFTGETVNYRKDRSSYIVEWMINPLLDERGGVHAWIAIQRDVTARRQNRIAQQESEERLRAIFSNASVGLSLIDREGRFLRANHELCRILGRPEEEVLQIGIADVTVPEDLVPSRAAVAEAIRSGKTAGLDKRYQRPDGTLVWANSRVTPMADIHGRPGNLLVVTVDLTERKQAEATVAESEERQGFLLSLSDAFRSLATPDDIAELAAIRLGEHLGVSRVFYGHINGDRMKVPRDYTCGVPSLVGEHAMDAFGQDFLASYKAHPMVSTSDVAVDAQFGQGARSTLRGRQVAAFVDLVLFKDEQEVSILAVQSATRREWTRGETGLIREVGERVKTAIGRAYAEAALHQSTQRLQALVTAGAHSIYHMRPDWRLVHQADSGTPANTDDPIEHWIDRYILEEDRPEVFAAIEQAIRTKSLFEMEHRVRLPNGAIGWVLSRAVPLFDLDGEITEWFGAGTDVTERREAAERVRESEDRLRKFGEASQDVLWIRDADVLQWQYLTPAFEKIYGLAREEALSGDNYRRWTDLIVPEDRALAERAIESVRQGEHVTFDFRIRRPVDGAIRWLRNTDFPIADAEGKVTLIGGIGHDLTELRETESRLQTLMEGIPQLVWRAVDGGHWTWSSPQWSEYTGLSCEQSLGRGWIEALHPDDREAAERFWGQAVRSGHLEMEARICHAASHQYRWFQTRATPVRDQRGAIIEWLGTSTDIEEMRALQERQHVLVAELQHRTRNLMAVVRSMADKTVRASADLSDFRIRFRDRLEALARVQGLLSRLNEHDRVTFDELIQTELAALDGSSERVTLSGPTGVRLRSSTVQTLAMALHELATNAVKYGALGQASGKLAIAWFVEPAGQDDKPWLHIDWHETGVEMPSATSAPRGTGQGRELIERALPYQLKAKTSYTLGADGVRCTISIPVSRSTVDMEDHA